MLEYCNGDQSLVKYNRRIHYDQVINSIPAPTMDELQQLVKEQENPFTKAVSKVKRFLYYRDSLQLVIPLHVMDRFEKHRRIVLNGLMKPANAKNMLASKVSFHYTFFFLIFITHHVKTCCRIKGYFYYF